MQPSVRGTVFSLRSSTAAIHPKFDLTDVMARVAKENPTWDAKRLAEAESEYRSFLAVAKATPGQDHHNTSVDMDAVWHSHILHTRQYHTDCAQFFGHYFHHAPSGTVGMCSGNCGGRCD